MCAAALALPTLCAVCEGWGTSRLCGDCRARHGTPRPRCAACALPMATAQPRCGACLAAALPMQPVITAVDYAFPWSRCVAALKFRGALDLAADMAALMAEAITGADAPRPHLVAPVPLGRERLAERGMNQAWELARRVAARLELPAEPGLLERRVETLHLAELPSAAERARAIRGAFALAPGASARLPGCSVALVDDVMTSGATASEAARTLLAAGASAVQLWVFARTP